MKNLTTMKALFLIISLLLSAYISEAQSTNKETSCTFKVMGVCDMCKERIETAALYTKGVKSATWNMETGLISVVYKPKKANEKDIHQSIAKAGYSTSLIKADSLAYHNLPSCCQYKDKEDSNGHKGHGH